MDDIVKYDTGLDKHDVNRFLISDIAEADALVAGFRSYRSARLLLLRRLVRRTQTLKSALTGGRKDNFITRALVFGLCNRWNRDIRNLVSDNLRRNLPLVSRKRVYANALERNTFEAYFFSLRATISARVEEFRRAFDDEKELAKLLRLSKGKITPKMPTLIESLNILGIGISLHLRRDISRSNITHVPIFDSASTGALLKELREYVSLNKSELSRLSGVNRQEIIKLESGKAVPRLDTFYKLVYSMGFNFSIYIPEEDLLC